MATALAGLKVLELGDLVSAAYATKLMADMGAEVIKLEHPAGDSARQRGPFPGGTPHPEKSGLFLYLNTNKLGATLDVTQPEGFELLDKLAAQGVRANTVSPGNTYFPGGVWPTIEVENPELFAEALALNPTGRMATPQEVANAVVFLSSAAASFITGTNLVVDGALTRGVQF